MELEICKIELTLTPVARAALLSALESSERKLIRLSPLGGGAVGLGFGLALTANAAESDLTLQREGLTFCVDAESAELLDRLEIDYDESGPEGAFIFRASPEGQR